VSGRARGGVEGAGTGCGQALDEGVEEWEGDAGLWD